MTNNHHTIGPRGQPRTDVCAGCEAPIQTPAALVSLHGNAGVVCPKCLQRANESTVFRDMVGHAIAAGGTLPEVRRLYARLGFDEIPTPEQMDRALGWPLGSMRSVCEGVKL